MKNLSSLNKDTEAHMKAQVSTKSMKTPGSTDPKAVHYDDDVKGTVMGVVCLKC